VAGQELKTLMKDDLDRIRQRLEQAKPETPTERVFRKVLLRTFQELIDNPYRTDFGQLLLPLPRRPGQ